jgi:hypothetical protein
MTPERWQQVKETLGGALALNELARAAYLDEVCAGDAELREEVESLLASNLTAGRHFLDVPLFPERDSAVTPTPANMIGAPASFESDRFAIRRVIGTGGMGIVYEAWDQERNQAVALKTIRRLNPTEIYYLKREFRALSDVSHPKSRLAVRAGHRRHAALLYDGAGGRWSAGTSIVASTSSARCSQPCVCRCGADRVPRSSRSWWHACDCGAVGWTLFRATNETFPTPTCSASIPAGRWSRVCRWSIPFERRTSRSAICFWRSRPVSSDARLARSRFR